MEPNGIYWLLMIGNMTLIGMGYTACERIGLIHLGSQNLPFLGKPYGILKQMEIRHKTGESTSFVLDVQVMNCPFGRRIRVP
jgi:hypothetical protein